MKTRCDNCMYWQAEIQNNNNINVGHCVRYPPQVVLDSKSNTFHSYFPETNYNLWCGEFKVSGGW
jgi:hypothetical protein